MTSPALTLNQQSSVLIEEHIRRLITAMGFTGAEVVCSYKDVKEQETLTRQHLHIDINAGPTGRMLIGAHGAHLQALQHIARSLIRRQLKEPIRITVDVNGYLARRERTLLHIAEEAARKAGRTGRAIVLPPMAAAHRRTIHTSLAARQNVDTESLGEEPNRRVVVKPVFI